MTFDGFGLTFEEFLRRGTESQHAANETIYAAGSKAARCAKCGTLFTHPNQYRHRGSDKMPICRDAKACRARGGK